MKDEQHDWRSRFRERFYWHPSNMIYCHGHNNTATTEEIEQFIEDELASRDTLIETLKISNDTYKTLLPVLEADAKAAQKAAILSVIEGMRCDSYCKNTSASHDGYHAALTDLATRIQSL